MKDALLPFTWAKRHGLFFTPEDKSRLVCRENVRAESLHELFRVYPRTCPEVLDDETFSKVLLTAYQQDGGQARQVMAELETEGDLFQLAETLAGEDDLLDCADDAPIIRFINAMLAEAIKERASDIHIEPGEQLLSIRFRVDGVLRSVLTPSRQLSAVMTSRIKVMSKLDIAEKRLPQDGRMALRIGGKTVDVRVSTLPSRHGERVVLRLLDKDSVQLALNSLGMSPTGQGAMRELLRQPHGIILVTGPTGSGKSTTLYAALNTINTHERNIMTVEDPIEYDVNGIGQTQVNSKVGMTFAKGLRAILRQDPDVIMIGEIRDTDTAQIAVQASLTGHLVLSTLHTNSAIGAVGRLRDMAVEPYLLASSLRGIISQRLVRTLCPNCKTRENLSEELAQRFNGGEQTHIYRAVGCEECNASGYRGRTGIHEIVMVNSGLRQAIAEGQNDSVLEGIIRDHTASLREEGFHKVLSGLTTPAEVMRVTAQE